MVLSLVNCVRIVADGNSSVEEKADAITKILATSITGVVLEILFEYAEKQFGLPDIFMEPLQIIVTIIAMNLIMLVLQKIDLFDVQYGLLVANIEKVFEEENSVFLNKSQELIENGGAVMEAYIDDLEQHIADIEQSISELDLFAYDAEEPLNQINSIFDMGIDFDQEWHAYVFPTTMT